MLIMREILKIYMLFVLILFTGRLVLFNIYLDRFNEISFGESLLSFVYGLRMDTILICMLLVIPTILLSIAPKNWSKIVSKIVKFYVLLFLLIIIFIENATIPFFAQYDVRPNYLFVQYLDYPKEVFSLLFKDYKLSLLISFIMLFFASKYFLKSKIFIFQNSFNEKYRNRILMLLPLLIILFIGIRSSFGHRPANNSDALYSTNRVINEITKNSVYSIAEAYYRNTKKADISKIYGKMEIKEAYENTSKILNINSNDEKRPFYREEKSHFPSNKPKNLVIFIQESMGAQFVEFSGGEKGLTPNLNALGKEYLSFSNLYSNGTRSIRGLSAMSSGFLPIAGDGVIKKTKSQNDFFTVASLLKPYGYKSSFIYGGEARFDNMKGWYLGNGFDEVIEQKDFENPTFTSTWGVCDEDLVIKANSKFKEYYSKGDNFVTVMFSQSNHAPFELPEGKINYVENEPKQSVKNAIKYADYAIGKFFELAQKEDYYKDTVFVVVADHNVRVYGDDLVPVNMFHIPAVIVSPDAKRIDYNKIATQPDVLATALDMIGIDLTYPILGHSIFSKDKQNISMMLFNDTFALMKDDKVAVIEPNMQPKTFIYENSKLINNITNDKELEKSLLSIIHVLEDMYQKKLYKQ